MAKKISTRKPAVKKKAADRKPDQEFSAKAFIKRMNALQSDVELEKIKRYFKSDDGAYGAGDKFMGIRMGKLFSLAKEFIAMPLTEVEKLLENSIHEVRGWRR